MLKFKKVDFYEYLNARTGGDELLDEHREYYRKEYDEIKLPTRSTKRASGYDFYLPYSIIYSIKGDPITIPTGICFETDRDDIWLMCMPRSGQGFKFGTALMNTVGNIDADYYEALNGGHIQAKIYAKKDFKLEKGDAFLQGVFVPFIKVDDDCVQTQRVGGFGSTDKERVT